MTLIEKVATALADLPGLPSSFDMARAAINAMREPTKEMLTAWKELEPWWDHSTSPPTLQRKLDNGPGRAWELGIETALKEHDHA